MSRQADSLEFSLCHPAFGGRSGLGLRSKQDSPFHGKSPPNLSCGLTSSTGILKHWQETQTKKVEGFSSPGIGPSLSRLGPGNVTEQLRPGASPHPVSMPPTEKNTDTCQELAEAKHNSKKQRHSDVCEFPWAQPGLRFHLRPPEHEGTHPGNY